MKLAVSNIAWPQVEESKYLPWIKSLGCDGIEIAPSLLWNDPILSTETERRNFRKKIENEGLQIVALQSILFNRPDLGLFRGDMVEKETIDYLKGLCQVAADVGAGVLVFGSPRNRRRGDLPIAQAMDETIDFFRRVAPEASRCGVCFGLEPLRSDETDFITKAAEATEIIQAVGNPGLKLHLDAKALWAEGPQPDAVLEKVMDQLVHYHISEPELKEIGSTGQVNHPALGKALQAKGYDRFVSIEMRLWPDTGRVIERSVQVSQDAYGLKQPILSQGTHD